MGDLIDSLLGGLIGAISATGLIVLIFVLNPEKIEIWASWIYRGARLFTRRAEYGLIAHDVAGQINHHIQKDLAPQVIGLTATGVRIRWHNTADTIVHEAEGTVFVRMRPHEERLANIFHATLAAAPRLIAPNLRSQIAPRDSKAIDIQLCRRLAEKMSQSAMVTFRLNVMEPALKSEPALQPILDHFQTIEKGGLFVPVFVQELVKLGATYPIDNLQGIDVEATSFYTFLKDIAEKPRGTDVNLAFLGKYIRVHVLLVAKAETKAAGIDPYRWRVGRSLAQGADTIYVLASGSNIPFAEQVVDSLDSDFRLIKGSLVRSTVFRDGAPTPAILVPFERNEEYFQANPAHLSVATEEVMAKGTRGTGTVIDIRPSYVTFDLNGIQAFIRAADLSWEYVKDCGEFIKVDDRFEVEVTGTDPLSLEVYASRKVCLPNPIESLADDQIIGKTFTIHIKGHEGRRSPRSFCFGVMDTLAMVPVRLYEEEAEWGEVDNPLGRISVGEKMQVFGVAVDRERGFVVCSRKRIIAQKWDDIRTRYPKGKQLTVTVLSITSAGAICEIEAGLVGLVPENEFIQAGLEYLDFRVTTSPGHKLYVYVGRVVAGQRQRLSLCLQRNQQSRPA